MALFTPAQLKRVRDIIDRYHAGVALALFGPRAVPPEVQRALEDAGVTVPKGPQLIKDAFAYGQVLTALADPNLAAKPPAEVRRTIAANPIPLTDEERASVDVASQHAGQYVVGLGTRVAGQVMAAVTGAEADLTPEDIVEIIRDKTAANRQRRETVDQLKSALGHAVGNWTRDWQRIATSESNDAIQEGVAATIHRRHGGDALVSKIPRPDACPDCKRLYLDDEGNPRIFLLDELRANGSNVGRPRAQWKPVIGSTHPWCGCMLVRVPPGMHWEDGELRIRKSEALEKAHKLHYRTTFAGLPISIENRKGSVRRWYDPHEDKHGETKMLYPYGYIRLTEGADGEHVDCYLGPDEDAPRVYVVHQRKKKADGTFGGYDEDKVMLGFASVREARRAYLAHYDDPGFLGSITTLTLEEFKRKLEERKGGKLTKALFIGPRGGKWADAAHTVSWREPAPKTKPRVDVERLLRGNLGIPRIEMPQIRSALVPEFLDGLAQKGVHVTNESVPAHSLRATQSELHADKIQGEVERGDLDHLRKPVIVSQDDFLLDGHHRWAALVTLDPGAQAKIIRVHLPIRQLLGEARGFGKVDFKKALYIGPKGGRWADPKHTVPYSPEKHGGRQWTRPHHEHEMGVAARAGLIPRAKGEGALFRKEGETAKFNLKIQVPEGHEERVAGVHLKDARDPERFAVIHRATKPGQKKWQISRFDQHGPVGDTSRGTLEEAIELARGDGYVLDEVHTRESLSKSLADEVDDLLKAAGHKYIRRIPTGKARPKYRYIYSVASKHHVRIPQVGDSLAFTDRGQRGHLHVVAVNPRTRTVTARHDETGREFNVSPERLFEMWHESHTGALSWKHHDLKKVYDEVVFGGRGVTPKQKERAVGQLRDFEKRYGEHGTRPPTLSPDTLSEAAEHYWDDLEPLVQALKQPPTSEDGVERVTSQLRSVYERVWSAGMNAGHNLGVHRDIGKDFKLKEKFDDVTKRAEQLFLNDVRDYVKHYWKDWRDLKGADKGKRTRLLSKIEDRAAGVINALHDAGEAWHRAREASDRLERKLRPRVVAEAEAAGKPVLVYDHEPFGVSEGQVRDHLNYMRRAIERVRRAGFGRALDGALFHLRYGSPTENRLTPGRGEGGHYRVTLGDPDGERTGDITVWAQSATEQSGARRTDIVAHELGHRYYYRKLTPGAREAWEEAITSRTIAITKSEVAAFKKVLVTHDVEFPRWDGAKRLTADELARLPPYMEVLAGDNRYFKRPDGSWWSPGFGIVDEDDMQRRLLRVPDGQRPHKFPDYDATERAIEAKYPASESPHFHRALKALVNRARTHAPTVGAVALEVQIEGLIGSKVLDEHITDYGANNPSEAFAEAFALYVVNGPHVLGPWTAAFFRHTARAGGATVKSEVLEGVLDELVKAAGHKYIRRIPTGKLKPKYRYIYRAAALGRYVGDKAEFHVGAKFRLADDGKGGHVEVIRRDGDKVRVRHDETGAERTMPTEALAQALRREHGAAILAHELRLKADVAAAMRFGTPKQRAMLEEEARRYGVKLHDYFASGSNHRGEIQGFHALGWNVGVAAPELTADAERELHSLAGKGTKVFVDSGAFSEIGFGPDGPFVKEPITDEEWNKRLALYERLAETLGPQLYAVAPDKVAFQDETLERLEKHAERVKKIREKGANILVPIQKGRRSMAEFDREAQRILGDDNFVRSIPMKKDATSTEELRAFLAEVKPARVHLLGLGPESGRYPEVAKAISEVSPTTVVTLDSVRITAAVGRDGKGGKPRRLTAAQDRVRLRMAPQVFNETFDGLDYTDAVGEPSGWMSPADLKRAADDMGLKGTSRKDWLKDPDAWLQGTDNGETKRYELPEVQAAVDRAWVRHTVGEVEFENGKPKLKGAGGTVVTRKREGIREAFGERGPAPFQSRDAALEEANARLEAARKQGKGAIRRAIEAREDDEVAHRYEVLDALRSGELGDADFARIHGDAYGPLESFRTDPLHNFRFVGEADGDKKQAA